jgi:hypothetical protein
MRREFSDAVIARVVYCTARVDAVINASAYADQDRYLKALQNSGSVDWIEYGNYVARVKTALVAVVDPETGRPSVQTALGRSWSKIKMVGRYGMPGAWSATCISRRRAATSMSHPIC